MSGSTSERVRLEVAILTSELSEPTSTAPAAADALTSSSTAAPLGSLPVPDVSGTVVPLIAGDPPTRPSDAPPSGPGLAGS